MICRLHVQHRDTLSAPGCQETFLWRTIFHNGRGCGIDRGLPGALNCEASLISFWIFLSVSPETERRAQTDGVLFTGVWEDGGAERVGGDGIFHKRVWTDRRWAATYIRKHSRL